MRSATALVLLAGLAACGAGATPAASQERLVADFTSELSTGGFDEPAGIPVRQDTLRLRYRGEGWSAQADLPWLRVAGSRVGLAAGAPAVTRPDEGPGDLRLKLTVPLRRATQEATGVDLQLRFKGSNARAVGGVDTGNAGQGVRVQMLRPVGDWKLSGHVGWRRAGDLPGWERSRHAWHGELGASRRFASGIEAGGLVDLRQRLPGARALREASLYVALDERERRWLLHVGRGIAPGRHAAWAGLSYRASF